ncbi:MAG: methyl-accepting chemotaxis protein [Clostridiaceae bacterium]
MSVITNNVEVLNAFKTLAPYLPEFFNEDIIITISEGNVFTYVSGAETLGVTGKVGDIINPKGADYDAVRTKMIVRKKIDKEYSGKEIESISIPIVNENNVAIGCIAVVKSLERQHEISNLSEALSKALNRISDMTDAIAGSSKQVSELNAMILDRIEDTNRQTKDTDEIIGFVKNIAKQTNLLGLNASIEASRAGDYGRGFNIVAKEIRKLSASSTDNLKKIEDILKNMQVSISSLTEKINDANDDFQKQAEEFQQVNELMEELSEDAEFLKNIAKNY